MLKKRALYFHNNSHTALIYFAALLLLIQLGCTNKNSETAQNDNSDSTETVATKPSSSEVAVNTLTKEEKDEGWILLFDGASTDSCRGYNSDQFPDKGWQIKDSLLM